MVGRSELHPLYVEGPNGPLFAVWYRPDGPPGDTVLYLPPFAEEMNRSRRTIAMLGRAMAARKLGLFVLDPFGTGDSAGGFEQATWAGWLADAAAALRFIEAAGHRVAGTMGLRTGALLALAAARTHGLARAMLCQPVESGRAYLTSLLRSRITAAQAGDGPRTTVAGLRDALAAGSCIEIMGYPLSPTLCAELETLDLAEAGAGYAGRVDWLHLAPRSDAPLPQKAADAQFRSRLVATPSFWLLERAPPADRFISEVVSAWSNPNAWDAG